MNSAGRTMGLALAKRYVDAILPYDGKSVTVKQRIELIKLLRSVSVHYFEQGYLFHIDDYHNGNA